jgi:hypothetical protein
LYHQQDRPEVLLRHIFGNASGILVTFSGRQGRLRDPDLSANTLEFIAQDYFRYPEGEQEAARHLLRLSEATRDAYVGVHLYQKPGSRLASNAAPTVAALWMDEDEGHFPETGPEPTAIVASSSNRRHLYWQLSRPVSVEWAVAMNRRLALWAGGDTGKAGLASVLRVPGTMNYKRHPQVDKITMGLTGAGPWEPEILDQAVPPLTDPSPPAATEPYDGPETDISEYLGCVEAFGEVADGLGEKYAIRCPWVMEHTGGDPSGTYLGKRADGGLWFVCHHSHCEGRAWSDFRLAVHGGFVRVTRPTITNAERTVKIRRD